jgi:tetratricopeptide (TPR) repeat protein
MSKNLLLSLIIAGLLAGCGAVKSAEPQHDSVVYNYDGLGSYAQARMAWNNGHGEQALALARQARVADSNSPYPVMLEAEILARSGQIQEALNELDRAIELAPDYRDPYLLGGSIMTTLGKPKEASDYLRNAVRLDPGREDAVLHLITNLMQLFEYEESVNALKGLVNARPESAVGNFYLGKVYSQMKLHRESIVYYKRALELRPDFTQARIDLAVSYEALSEYDLAIDSYKLALEEAENRSPLILHLVQLFIQNRRYEDALEYLQRLDNMGLGTTENSRKTGLIYMELGRYDDAIRLFQNMLEADPEAHNIRFYLGSAYVE